MSTKQIDVLTKGLEEVRKLIEDHLIESTGIKTNIDWLKRAFWVLCAAGITFNTMLVVAVISYVLNHR